MLPSQLVQVKIKHHSHINGCLSHRQGFLLTPYPGAIPDPTAAEQCTVITPSAGKCLSMIEEIK